MAPPGEAVAAPVADDVAFCADQLPDLETRDVGADGDDLPTELMPDGHGSGNGGSSPIVPVEDVQIGAADASGEDPDQDVIGPGVGNGDLIEAKPDFVGVFDQGSHRPER